MNNITAPYIRTDHRANRMIWDMLLACMVLGIFSAVTYGPRPLYILLVSCLTAVVCETVCCFIGRRPMRMALDGSAVITGMVVGLLMSPIVDMWVPMVGSAFAIVVAKAPFGGTGRNVFNPAAAGIALLTYCFPAHMFTYPAIESSGHLPWAMTIQSHTELSLAGQLKAHAIPAVDRMDILLGNFTGPIGATAFLVLLTLAAYLMVRRTASPWIIIPYFATCALLAWTLPLSSSNPANSFWLELGSGYLIFAGVFLINDPVTAPRFWLGRLIYGALSGCMVILLQREGRFEANTCFAVLIMNAFAPIIDRWSWHLWYFLTHKLFQRKEVEPNE